MQTHDLFVPLAGSIKATGDKDFQVKLDAASQSAHELLQFFKEHRLYFDASIIHAFQKVDNATRSWHGSEEDALARSREFIGAAGQLQQSLTDGAERVGNIVDQQARLLEKYSSGGFSDNIERLQEQIGRLAERVGALSSGDGVSSVGPRADGSEAKGVRPEGPNALGGLLARLRGRLP